MIDDTEDEEDIGLSEHARLKDYARGKAGAALGDQLGLPAPAGDEMPEALPAEEPLAPEGGGGVSTASLGGQGGDPLVLLDTYNFGDEIHLNARGNRALAALVAGGSP